MSCPKYADERNKVLLGNLPDDFLRFNDANQRRTVNGPTHSTQTTQQHQQQIPNATMDQIIVCVIEATLVKNYSLTKMDPYVKLRIGHTVYETTSDLNGGKSPRWNRTITSHLPRGIKTIHIEIYDENTITSDERVAYVDYVIPEDVLKGQYLDTWIPLSGKQGVDKEGSIHVTIYIRPLPYWQNFAPPAPVMVVPQPAVGTFPYFLQGQPVVHYAQQPIQNPNYMQPIQQPSPQPYQPKEEDVKQIQEMFPHFDREVILGVLETSQGNKEHAITSLLTLSDK